MNDWSQANYTHTTLINKSMCVYEHLALWNWKVGNEMKRKEKGKPYSDKGTREVEHYNVNIVFQPFSISKKGNGIFIFFMV